MPHPSLKLQLTGYFLYSNKANDFCNFFLIELTFSFSCVTEPTNCFNILNNKPMFDSPYGLCIDCHDTSPINETVA